jgi:hypothetical protein
VKRRKIRDVQQDKKRKEEQTWEKDKKRKEEQTWEIENAPEWGHGEC